jgi:uncharacterized protein YdhG (YjbR/CyaY superfamily)
MRLSRRPAPKTVDEYLAGLPPADRAALARLRGLIREAAPGCTESLVYGMPTFRYGRMRLSIAAYRDHGSLYGWAQVRVPLAKELGRFQAGKGTLRFTAARPLPARLVTRIVKGLLALEAPPPPPAPVSISRSWPLRRPHGPGRTRSA